MSVSSGSGSVSVNGTVTAAGTFNATKNTVLSVCGRTTSNATTTVATVTAGKVWRIIGASIDMTSGNATSTLDIKFNDVVVMAAYAIGTTGTYSNTVVDFKGSYADAFVLTAGQTIKTVASANCVGHYNFYYIEEAA